METGSDLKFKNQLRDQRIVLLVCLMSLVSFLVVAWFKSSFVGIDGDVNLLAASIQTGSFTVAAVVISYVFDTISLFAISLFIAVYLFFKNYRKNSLLLVAAIGGDAVLVSVAKALVQSARPLNGLLIESGYSFPSGHAASSLVFCGLLTYFVWQRWKTALAKVLSCVLLGAIVLVVGFDRIYLNVHWFSDVLGGFFLGVFWLAFSVLAFQYFRGSHQKLSHLTGQKRVRLAPDVAFEKCVSRLWRRKWIHGKRRFQTLFSRFWFSRRFVNPKYESVIQKLFYYTGGKNRGLTVCRCEIRIKKQELIRSKRYA